MVILSKSELKYYEWAECDSKGNIVAKFDWRGKLPIYDMTTDSERKQIEAIWGAIEKQLIKDGLPTFVI